MFNLNEMEVSEYPISTQEHELLACRSFYEDEAPIPVVGWDDLVAEPVTEIVVNDGNLQDLCTFLRDWRTWFSFKPAVVEDERGLVLVF